MTRQSRFKVLVNNINDVCNRIYLYEDNLKKYEQSYKELKEKTET